MPFQAKSNLAMFAILAIVYAAYFAVVARWVAASPIEDIVYQPLMVLTVIPIVVLAIIAHGLIAVAAPSEAGAFDERDRAIDRRGEAYGGFVLGIGVFAGLVLAMLEVDTFWIAQVLLAALVLSELVKSATTLILYRMGT